MDGLSNVPDTASARPYFLPSSIDLEAFPAEVRLAVDEILMPVYREMVMGAQSSLERAAAVSLAFLLYLELIDQFAIGQDAIVSKAGADESARRDKAIERYSRIVGAKQKVLGFLQRLEEFRARQNLIAY